MNEYKNAIIICDFDGKIKVFDKNAEILFNCSSDEVIKNRRVFNLLHPDFVLSFANKFNSFLDKKDVELKNEFVYLQSNDTTFSGILTLQRINNSLLRILIEKKIDKNNISYNKSSALSKINLILRSKFIIGSLVPFFFSIVWSIYRFNTINYRLAVLIFIAVCLLHICANTFNDYFDWKSGRDKDNLDYVLFSTGGSRAIDLKLISAKQMLYISIICLILVILLGTYFIYLCGWVICVIGLCAIFSVYFYSAPPIHLASRYGLGELMHVICLGPLIVAGTTLLLSNTNILFIDFFIGLPFGLLITGCLLMNEYPDSKFDKISGKFNLAVVLGARYIPYMYIFLQFLSFVTILISIYLFNLTQYFLLILLIIPYSIKTAKTVFNIKTSRTFVTQACIKSFYLYIYFSFILIISLLLCISL